MFNCLFLNCHSSNIYNTLGALKSLKKELSDIVIYNTMGSASLIVFLKILGFNYDQMFDILKDFDLCKSLINGFTIMVENETEKKNYIKEFLISLIKQNDIINNNITLQETYKLTNIFPCFLMWDKLNESIINVNPKHNPNYKLIDCVMASLSGIGTFLDYSIEDSIYGNLLSIDCFPHENIFNLDKKINTLYVFNNMKYGFENTSNNFGPLKDIEDELLKQQFNRNKSKLSFLKEVIPRNNLLIINSEFYRERLENIKLRGLFKNGSFQAEAFKAGEDTKKGIEKQLDLILNQC